MPSFKPKTDKEIVISDIDTIDVKHKNIIDNFNYNVDIILPKLKKKRKLLKKKMNNKNISDVEMFDINDNIKMLTNRIKMIKKDVKEYHLNNSKYIFDYFENKKDISIGKKQSKAKMLNMFFKQKSNDNLDKNIKNNLDKNIKKYLTNIDDKYLNINDYINDTYKCDNCNIGEMIIIIHEGNMICNNCSKINRYLIEYDKPSYKEPPKEVCFYAYKRINHFREILAQFQAKETTQISEEVLINIKKQIKKERIQLSQLDNNKAKDILKKLGYNKYYEHIPFIKDKLGIKPPIMTQELEETLCNLFIDIQGPYAKYCPDDRVNFLNYYYTIYKLCELLNQTQFLPYFPMLKDREKRIEQDEIWKKICGELDWEFIPTI